MTGYAAPALPLEIELLACAARPQLDAARARHLASLAWRIADWESLRNAAARHCLVPLLFTHLEAHAADAVPPEALSALREDYHLSAEDGLKLAAALLEVLDALRGAGIEAIPYKGPILAVQAYRRLALRQFQDLDFLLRQRDVPRALAPLAALGYLPELPLEIASSSRLIPGQYLFNHQPTGTILELHTERTQRYFPVPLNVDHLAARLVSVPVAGHAVPALAPADALPILCVHGSTHFWDRLGWIADIAALASDPEMDWDQVFDLANQLGARRMLFLGLDLAGKILACPLPDPVLYRVGEDAVVPRLVAHVREQLCAADFASPGIARRLWFRVRMRGTLWQGFTYSLRLATVPTEEDWAQARLSGPLAPFYSVLRPFRLLRKYGTGLFRTGSQPPV